MSDTATMTWSAINAMSRSHAWSVTRGIPSARTCGACADTFDSTLRYCPGDGAAPATTLPDEIPLPGLEDTSAVRPTTRTRRELGL